MDLADLIDSFSTKPEGSTYVVTRRLASTFVNGRAVLDPSPTTLQIVASVQPAKGNDLLRLPEARRTNETRLIFTSTKLLPGGENFPNEADRVSIDGKVWEVQHVESWIQPGGDEFYRCIAQESL